MAKPSINLQPNTLQPNTPVDLGPPPSATGPLLVATTGSSDSDAAVVAANLFAGRTNATVQVLTVVTPIALGYTMGTMPLTREIDAGQRDAQFVATRTQIHRLVGGNSEWPISTEFGEPAQAIADAARMRNARLIVVGHGQHSTAERLLGGDHILQALQLGDTPVFAASPMLTTLPERVVIATDFSDLSAYAAQFALSFIAPNANIYLVNVMPNVNAGGGGWEHDWADSYRRTLADAFNTAKNALHREQLTIEPVTLTGNAADETIKFANAHNADLIVCATHGHGFLRRLILGSVATKLIRNAHCSVLCVPGSARNRAAMQASNPNTGHTRVYAANQWADALQEFSTRNEGRCCSIEVDERAIGAQPEADTVPFVGAAYDYHGNSVALMFGEQRPSGEHFTHTITNVTGIDVQIDAYGADRSLRISNLSGQTILVFAVSARYDEAREEY